MAAITACFTVSGASKGLSFWFSLRSVPEAGASSV